MTTHLETISAFAANMKAYPVAAAILTLVLFALLAKITVSITQRVIRKIYGEDNQKFRDKLTHILRIPTWTILLLLGFITLTRWLNPLPQYQYVFLGLLKTLILLVFLISFSKFMTALFSLWHKARDLDDTILNQIEGFGKVLTFGISLAFLLAIWQVDLAPVLASAGVLGIVVAIAAQDSLSNLFAGISLFLDRPFKVGDYVVLDTGERGEVIWLGMRSTRLLTRGNVQVTVPNSIMAGTKIVNESAPNPRYRVSVKVGVAYGSDLEHVENTLLSVAKSNPTISSFPDPRVRFRNFGESSLNLELLCWAIQPKNRGIIVHQLSKAIYKVFKDENILIPFPQHDVHVHHLSTEGSGTVHTKRSE